MKTFLMSILILQAISFANASENVVYRTFSGKHKANPCSYGIAQSDAEEKAADKDYANCELVSQTVLHVPWSWHGAACVVTVRCELIR